MESSSYRANRIVEIDPKVCVIQPNGCSDQKVSNNEQMNESVDKWKYFLALKIKLKLQILVTLLK